MKYTVTISQRDEWDYAGRPVRDVVFETDDLNQAIAYMDAHGGTVDRDGGAVMTPTGELWLTDD